MSNIGFDSVLEAHLRMVENNTYFRKTKEVERRRRGKTGYSSRK